MIASIAGLLLGLATILSIRLGNTENKAYAYPLVLASYPFFYIGFAFWADDFEALRNELVFAAPFFVICAITAIKNLRYSATLLGFAYLLHGVYDLYHNHLFINSGMPLWWPAFCAAVDFFIGIYLAVISINFPAHAMVFESEKIAD